MCLNRLDADFQALGDFPIFKTRPDELQDLLLSIGESFRTLSPGG